VELVPGARPHRFWEGKMSETSETPLTSGVIAVGVDESESSHRALRWAAHEALRRGAAVEVVTAWSWDAVEGAPLAAVDPTSLRELAESTQRRALTEVIDPMEPRPAVTCRVVQASATEALADASQHADLLVVGTHGRGPVRSFLLGSVSLSVIKHAACPVVVMPPVDTTQETSSDLTASAERSH
jgi:nucleotide-binding universal stress UspA family protein